MKQTEKDKKNYTKAEKLKIIQECKANGVTSTCSKYGIYPASYYYWKKQLLVGGIDGLNHGNRKKDATRIKTLEKELETMKLLLAEEQLKSRLKDDLISIWD